MNSNSNPNATNCGRPYQMYRICNAEDTDNIDSQYGLVMLSNFFPEFFFENTSIELKGGIEIEPQNQKVQLTKMVHFLHEPLPLKMQTSSTLTWVAIEGL